MHYQIKCPFCQRVFEAKAKYMLSTIYRELSEHLESDHFDQVEDWFKQNRKKWYYVKSSCLKPFKGYIIGTLGGTTPLIVKATQEQFRKLKDARNLRELVSALDGIASAMDHTDPQQFATLIQAAVLIRWIFSYFAGKTTTLTISP